MIGIVFRKEMLSHLLSQRFAACTALAVVLIIANGMLTSQAYVQKKASYLTQRAVEETKLPEITYYSVLGSDMNNADASPLIDKAAPRALRPPRALEVFVQGVEQEVGPAVKVLLFEVPYQTEAIVPFQSGNPYLAIFASFDMVLHLPTRARLAGHPHRQRDRLRREGGRHPAADVDDQRQPRPSPRG